MTKEIRILHLEDLESDADIIHRELKKCGFPFVLQWVRNRAEFEKALAEFFPDVVLCDHSLPSYDSMAALNELRSRRIRIPFILITATIAEESVVQMIQDGMDDYVLKDRLSRLPTAIVRAIERAEAARDKEFYLQRIIRAEKRFRALIENMAEGILLVNEKNQVSFISPSVTRISGYEYGEVIGRSIFDFIYEKDINATSDLIRLARMRESVSMNTVYRIRNKSGAIRWVEGTITNLLADESVGAMVINYRDITERKEAELKLKKSEANLRAIFNNTQIAYVLLDNRFRIISFNKTALENTSWQSAPRLTEGASLIDYFPEEKREILLKIFEEVLAGKKSMHQTNFRNQDGTYSWYKIHFTPVQGEKSGVYGMIVTAEDITLLKNRELEREKMTSDLIQHNKNLEQFAYIISHNLRSPVANILGLSGLILRTPDMKKEDFRRCMEGLEQSVKRLDEIIIDLNYILQVRREVNEQKEMVNLNSLVKDIRASISNLIEKENITLKAHFSGGNEIFTIKSYLYSIFYNLISNSIKYRHPSRPAIIEVKGVQQNNKLFLSFKDNGLGIDIDKYESKIFGLYKKFHHQVEGKGMGLYMVKTQVEILGGNITVRSEVDQGTEFLIEFDL